MAKTSLEQIREYLEEKKNDRRENQQRLNDLLSCLSNIEHMLNSLEVKEKGDMALWFKRFSLFLHAIGIKTFLHATQIEDDTLVFACNNNCFSEVFSRMFDLQRDLFTAHLHLNAYSMDNFKNTRDVGWLEERKIETVEQLNKILKNEN